MDIFNKFTIWYFILRAEKLEKNIQIRNIGWIEIDNLIDEKTFEDDQYFQDFKNFICFLEILKINSLIILFKLKTKIKNYF